MAQHLQDLRQPTRKNRWVKKLLRCGLKPINIVLETVPDELAADCEREWIRILRLFHPLTNLTEGGDGAPGYVYTPEQRHRLSAAKKGVQPSAATRAIWSEQRKGRTPWNKGVPAAPSTRAIWSKQRKGRTPPNKGKPASPEVRALWSQQRKGRRLSAETRAKMSAARKGQIPWNKGAHYKQKNPFYKPQHLKGQA